MPFCDKNQEELLAYFIIFISGYVESWLFHEFIKENEYETFFACRSLATYKLASFLGVAALVPCCKFVKLVVEGEPSSFGVLCENAPGTRGLDSKALATPTLQQDFSKLSMLDALTYETDHFANNYNVLTTSGGATGVCAFDNDSKWTFFPNPLTPRKTARNGTGLLKWGGISLSFLDKRMAEVIMNVNRQHMASILAPYLNNLQILALMNRLRLLNKALRNHKEKLFESEHFNSETVDKELASGVRSYLYQYVHREELNMDYTGK